MSIVRDFLLQLVFIPTIIFTFQVFISEKLKKPRYAKVIQSVLFAVAIVLCITYRAHISPEFDLDVRIVPLLLGTLFGGWETGAFLGAVVMLYRLHLGLNAGFYSTTITLVLCMPVFVFFQKSFVKANKKKRIQITLILCALYVCVGFASVSLIQSFSLHRLQAMLIQLVISIVFLFFFVTLNEFIKETLRKNEQLQSEVYEAEIAFLRAQIKPHFLYNALNSIAALCVDEPRRAEELIVDLSQVLKSGFDFKRLETLTTLDNELELVKAYLNIEKARFGDRLSVEYDVDTDLDTWIPPLTLQPLVENAVRHGLMCKMLGGTIKISIRQESQAVVRFSIEDNGRGMTAKKLEDILNPTMTKKGVGLWNISQRMKHHYGKPIRVESTEGIGTKVSFDIPV